MQRERRQYLLIPIAAFVAIIPLLFHGCSCGHDFDFHLLNWMEAARQFTHGNLHPHWAYTPAYNAGEPRFVFYPPLSWTIGAILGLIFPWTWTPILYTWLALTAAGLGAYYLARNFTTSAAALIAATLYTVNPYMLFTAYERTAYAELLAAAWIPLLLHAILRKQVTIARIAIPIALLWLTNAPAAVMSCYALALLTVVRFATTRITTNPAAQHQPRLQLAVNTISGTALGMGLAAFYILPAAYERRFVQIAMAIIPSMRIQDNFLFHHTGELLHDQVLHTASLIAIILIAATAVSLTTLRLMNKAPVPHPSPSHREQEQPSTRLFFAPLAILTIAITVLLTPPTGFIWSHAPELTYLQFPWRLLAILAAVLCLTIALAITPLKLKPIPTIAITLAAAVALTFPAYRIFHQACDPEDTVEARLALFQSNRGAEPTDEYTPTTADNDSLTQTNPPYWLSTDPNANAPLSVAPSPAPTHLTLNAPTSEDLILDLRNYPGWKIALNGTPIATRIQRDDGLIAIPIPSGPSTVDITYNQTLDQTFGDILSVISLAILAFLIRRTTRSPR